MCIDTCCCMITVKAGTLILLWATVIFWGLMEIAMIRGIVVAWLTPSPKQISKVEPEGQEPLLNDLSLATDIDSETGYLFGLFCMCSVILAIAISGLYAIEKRKPMLLIPYFMYRIFWTVLICILAIPLIRFEGYEAGFAGKAIIISSFFGSGDWPVIIISYFESAVMLAIVIEILIIVIQIHFTSVVYKCYRHLGREEEVEKNAIPMTAAWSASNKTNFHLTVGSYCASRSQVDFKKLPHLRK